MACTFKREFSVLLLNIDGTDFIENIGPQYKFTRREIDFLHCSPRLSSPMFPTLLSTSVLLALSTAVTASPVLINEPRVSLPIVKRFNFTGTASVRNSDLARARGFRARAEARRTGNRLSPDAVVSFPVENQAGIIQSVVL